MRFSARCVFALLVLRLCVLDRFLGGFSVSTETVESAGKDMHDRQEVFGELLLGRGVLLIENHESNALSFEQPFDEFESKSAESVSMGNAHFS